MCWVVLCAPVSGSCAEPPPCHFPLGTPRETRYCVSVNVKNGFITVLPSSGKLRIGPGFSSAPLDQEKLKQLKQELASYLQMILNRRKLYEFALDIANKKAALQKGTTNSQAAAKASADSSNPGATSQSASAQQKEAVKTNEEYQRVPQEVEDLSADDLPSALKTLREEWPKCPDCENLATGIIAALPDLCPKAGGTLCGLPHETPLSGIKLDLADVSAVVMVVDPIFDKNSAFDIRFDDGSADGSSTTGKLLTTRDVRVWLAENYDGRFWIQKDIRDHFQNLYQDVGLSPTIIVSEAGRPRRSIRIQESTRIGRILIPGSDASPDQDTEKLLYVVLTATEFGAFNTTMLTDVKALSERILCIPQLHGSKCDDQNVPTASQYASLGYLNAWRLSEWQAGLQPLGFSVATVNEPILPGQAIGDDAFPGPVDLEVQRVAKGSGQTLDSTPSEPSSEQSSDDPCNPKESDQNPKASKAKCTSGPRPEPSAQAIPTATSRAVEPSAAVASAPKLILKPAKPTEVPSPPVQHKYAVGAAVIYRPNQPMRILGLFQLSQMKLPSVLGDTTTAVLLKGGSDGTNPVGEGSLSADYVWFNHLRKRFSVSFNYGTDAVSDRILEGESTNQRQTGPSASINLELIRYRDGWNLNSYVQPLSQRIGLTPQGSSQLNAYVNELATGLILNYQSSVTFHPLALTFKPEVTWGYTSGQSTFWKLSTNCNLHLRLINSLLVSLDMHGSYGFASVDTPVFTVPSLGGADSVRGLRQDAVLGRALWSLQNEVWVPAPGTLKTNNANGVQQFLRKSVRIALFYDVGDVQKTDVNPFPFAQSSGLAQFVPGVRQGTGIGLRFIQVPIALKLDWAYGFGQSASGANHGRVYLGAATSGAF